MFLGKWRETTVAIKLLSQSMFSSATAMANNPDDGGLMAAAQRWHPCDLGSLLVMAVQAVQSSAWSGVLLVPWKGHRGDGHMTKNQVLLKPPCRARRPWCRPLLTTHLLQGKVSVPQELCLRRAGAMLPGCSVDIPTNSDVLCVFSIFHVCMLGSSLDSWHLDSVYSP